MRIVKLLGYAWRTVELAVFLGAMMVTYAAGALAIRVFRRGEMRVAALGRWRGKLMRTSACALGATFVKLGQVMSSRPDLFSPEFIAEVATLQDRLPPFGYRAARRLIEEDLGRPLNDVFRSFDELPLAAASVAQVHRAELTTGQEVAVKVLRPGVRMQIQRDAVLLTGAARVLAWSPTVRLSDPVGHLREFVDAILEQTDLRIEAANQRTFAENFAGQVSVHFPTVYDAACGPRVLTMEFLRGDKIDAVHENRRELARTLREMMLQMCFVDGFVHADLHPGNFLVRDARQLLVFDAGMAKHLPDNILTMFIDFVRCVTSGTPDDFVRHCQTYHTYAGDIDWVGLRADAAIFITTFRQKPVGTFEYGALFADIFRIARTYGVRPIPELTLVMVAMLTAQGIGMQLEPETNVFAEVAKFLARAPRRRPSSMPC